MKRGIYFLILLSMLAVSEQVRAARTQKMEVDKNLLSYLNAEAFAGMLKFAKTNGIYEITFVAKSAHSQKVSESFFDENYSGGDAFIMHGLAPEKDKQMRQNEYRALFPIVDYLSRRRMRVTVNLHAGTADLRTVLKNHRPTIVIWSSHGNDEFFYGSNGEAIPHGIFKQASPMVYQFILSACYGRLALDNYYLKDLPQEASLTTTGWKGLTNSDEMMAYLMSDRWDMYKNRPAFANQGLICQDKTLVRISDGVEIKKYDDASTCAAGVIQARENMACLIAKDSAKLVSVSRNEALPGDVFDDMWECADRLSRAYQKKLCLRNGTEIRIVDSVSGQSGSEVFKSMRDCEQKLITEISL